MNARAPLSHRLELEAERLSSAARAQDWPAAVSADRALRALAAELVARSRWAVSEHQAVINARVGVQAALDAVAAERQRLVEEMHTFNRYRSAWVAYAICDEARSFA